MGHAHLLVKEGFTSTKALIFNAREGLVQTKTQRGQQKVLFKTLMPMQQAKNVADSVNTDRRDTNTWF